VCACSQKACKYFDQGRGECPFNEKCFYLHALPDGSIASPRPVRRRQRQNADGEIDVVRHLMLWDVIQEISERRSNLASTRAVLGDLSEDLEELFLHLNMYEMSESSEEEEDV